MIVKKVILGQLDIGYPSPKIKSCQDMVLQ